MATLNPLTMSPPGRVPYNGDGLQGGAMQDSATRFLARRSVRDTWIAIWVMWFLWALLFLAKQAFGPPRLTDALRTPRTERVVTESGVVVSTDGLDGLTGPAADSAIDTTTNGIPPTTDGAHATTTDGIHPTTTDGIHSTTTDGIHSTTTDGTHPTTTASPAIRQQMNVLNRATDDIRERIVRTYNLVRDLTLMLLLVVTLNHFGLSSGVFVLIMSWIYFGIALMWSGSMMLIENRILDVAFGTIEMLLLLAMLIGAYTLGWTVI